MRALLDTCTFLWAATGSPRLSENARRAIEDPMNEIFLSTVSAWEIAVKHILGSLPLPKPPDPFVVQMRRAMGIDSLALDEEAALQIAKLPLLHRDPFDRMLICQAVVHGLVLVTPDERITRYAIRTHW